MKEKIGKIIQTYQLPLLILAVGIVLMLLPLRSPENKQESQVEKDSFSLTETEEKMERILGNIAGVGRVNVMLTLKSGSALQLAQDKDYSERDSEKKADEQVVKLNRGSGVQEVIVTHEISPTYLGAVVVCDGADNAEVCLAVTEAVAVLTGLSSDKIRVAKWNFVGNK